MFIHLTHLSFLLPIPLRNRWILKGHFFIYSLNVFADEEEEQAANISVAEQDFKFMDFARR